MSKVFRPSSRESSILSRIESSKEYARRKAIAAAKDCFEPLSNAVATKLVSNNLVETTNKNGLEEQIRHCLETLSHADDFDIDYQISPFRNLVHQPHVVSLYLTAFVLEKVIKHKDTVDIYGSDEDIYLCIHGQVRKFLSA
jgi:peptide subunit release factor 1 (eRF1)